MNIVISNELNKRIDEMEQDPNNTETWKEAATKFGRAQGWKLSKTAFAASKLLPKGPFPKRNYRVT